MSTVLPSESGCDCVMVSIAEEILEKSNNTTSSSNFVIKVRVWRIMAILC
jgi:hypothetical protein